MKLYALLPLFATAAFASTDSSSSASDAAPPAKDPTPVGALWTATWNDTTLAPFTRSCASKSTYRGAIYKLAKLYPDLETFAPQLKIFYNKQLYPGSWSGVDAHGNERELIKMDMSDLPWKVREWIKSESTQRHYSVQDDVVFFAPGAIYPILPLWVDEPENTPQCESAFERLDVYSNEPKDGSVIGKVSHSEKAGEVEFTVEALKVALKAGGERNEL